MASSVPLQLAETIQTAHIRQNPSVARDVAPSTAADSVVPVVLEKAEKGADLSDEEDRDDGLDGNDNGALQHRQTLPYSVIRPAAATQAATLQNNGKSIHGLPPLPDLRFEQSYLHSIAAADCWWKVVLVTARDQVIMPFVQGLLYNAAVCGWQYWNRSAQLSGQSWGAQARRWWYGVNKWPVPKGAATARRLR